MEPMLLWQCHLAVKLQELPDQSRVTKPFLTVRLTLSFPTFICTETLLRLLNRSGTISQVILISTEHVIGICQQQLWILIG